MTAKVLHPQEIETFYIIPTLRRYFALYLKQSGMKQKDIASLLGVTTASISQYASTKRGHKIHFSEEIEKQIKQSTLRIKSRITYFQETQYLLQLLRREKVLCRIHRQFSSLPDDCDPKIIGCHKAREGRF